MGSPLRHRGELTLTTTGSLGMDYAMKRKLIEKRREIVQRASKAVHGKMSATSTSIFTNKKSFNFNDVIRAEKENQQRN